MKRALAQVNRAREALGLRPLKKFPKGYQDNPHNCPVTNALCAASTGTGVAFTDEDKADRVARAWRCAKHTVFYATVPLPRVLATFVDAFDAGRYPELIARGAK